MYAINEINFDLPAFLLSVFSLVYCFTVKRRQYVPPKTLKAKLTSQHFVFTVLLITNAVSSGTSVLGLLLEHAPSRFYFWQYLTYALYFIFHSTLSICFALYIMDVTGTGANWRKAAFVLFSLPYAVSEVLVLINSFNGWTFRIDGDMSYHRGPLMYLLIPFLFVSIGMKTDFSVFARPGSAEIILLTIAVLVGTKLGSGYAAMRMCGFGRRAGLAAGLMTVPQLSATLTAAAIGKGLGILDERFFNAVIVLSIVTTLPVPSLVRALLFKRGVRRGGTVGEFEIPDVVKEEEML